MEIEISRLPLSLIIDVTLNIDISDIIINQHTMASIASLQTFPGFSKEAIPQDWFAGVEEVGYGS